MTPILDPSSGITKQEQQVLESYLFSNTPLPDLWRLFINCRDKKDAIVRRESTEFINSQSAQEYLEDRKRQWDALMMGNSTEADDGILDESGEFTSAALRKIKKETFEAALGGDRDSAKQLMSFILKMSKATTEGTIPLRVLASTCSECVYKTFMEEFTPIIQQRGEVVVKYNRTEKKVEL